MLQTQRQQAQAQLEQMRAAAEQAADQSVAHRHHRAGRRICDQPDRRERQVCRRRAGADDVRAARRLGDGEFQGNPTQSHAAGQPVDITVDAYPGRTFKGHVASIQAGSGTAFSLLPAENATGNYVKIVQRVPVKIVFDKPPDVLLGPGMSVRADVKVK